MAVCAYLQALHYPFGGDDNVYIVTNKNLGNLPPAGLWHLLIEPYNGAYEFLPLRDLSYWIDMRLFGQESPAPYRLHSILLYLLCLPLLYASTAGLWRYFRPNDTDSARWAAATVTALFAIHPALVESVVWVSGRKYILPDFFSLLAIWLAIKSRQESGFSSRYAAATLAAFVGVMFSKTSYVGVAPIIALLWLRFRLDLPAPQRRRSLLLWPAAIMLLAVFLLAVFIVNNQGYDTVPFYFGIEAVYRSLGILGGLTRIALTPEPRHYLYPLFEDPWFPAMIALGAIMLLASAWGVAAFLRRRSFTGFVLLVFFLLCLPYLQLIPARPPSLIADRYVSLAVWPAVLVLVMFIWQLKPVPRIALLFIVALPWLFQTAERPNDWRSDEALLTPDLRAYPGYFLPAYYKIVHDQMPKGLYRQATETADVINTTEVRKAILGLIQVDRLLHTDLVPTQPPHEALDLLVQMSSLLEHPPAQVRWNSPLLLGWERLNGFLSREWKFLADSFPGDVSVRYNAGMYMFNKGNYKDALPYLRTVVDSRDLPVYARGTLLKNFGIALLGSGHAAEAVAPLRAALIQSPPDFAAYCALSDAYKLMGMPGESKRTEVDCIHLAKHYGTPRG